MSSAVSSMVIVHWLVLIRIQSPPHLVCGSRVSSLFIDKFLFSLPYNIFVSKFSCLAYKISQTLDLADCTPGCHLKCASAPPMFPVHWAIDLQIRSDSGLIGGAGAAHLIHLTFLCVMLTWVSGSYGKVPFFKSPGNLPFNATHYPFPIFADLNFPQVCPTSTMKYVGFCYGLNVCMLPNFINESLTPKVMVFEVGPLGSH